MSLIGSLNTGLTGILANQKAVETTGNNVANVNTPGYSRQFARLSPNMAINIQGHIIGQGVNVQEISREYDHFISGQLLNQHNVLGNESAKKGPLAELERVFNTGEYSLASDIERFFGAWHDLSQNPSGHVERDRILYEGDNLLDSFAQTKEDLVKITQNINVSLTAKVNEINLKVQEVAKLNENIRSKEVLGHTANNDRDRRDLLLNDLSNMIGIQTYQSEHGQTGVQLPGGIPLVHGNYAAEFESYYDGDNIQFRVKTGDIIFPANKNNFGGEFRGFLDIRDTFIPELENSLDELKNSIVTEVNAQHEEGYDLDGRPGRPFFSKESDVIIVEINSAQEIAAAGATTGAPGDNENALSIYALFNAQVINDKESFMEFCGRMSSTVGTESRRNAMALGGASDTLTQLKNMLEASVGVSLEQEIINLTLFQRGFEACCTYVSTIDEMMATVLSMKR
jgi:flagellar hook-associated protein 1 FlgK